MATGKPLIVQSDRTLLLEVNDPTFKTVRDAILPFSELIKSPEHVHSYRISRVSLWNASTSGLTAESILGTLRAYSRYPIPLNVQQFIVEETEKYGRLVLKKRNQKVLLTGDRTLLAELGQHPAVSQMIAKATGGGLEVPAAMRGEIKRVLAKLGYPVKDLVGYSEGAPLPIRLGQSDQPPGGFRLRPYQEEAVRAFLASGSGVIVLPCGAGKTVVGLAAMAAIRANTLILTPNVAAVQQWMREIADKCEVPDGALGEYTTDCKQVKPITVTTYQMLTYTRNGRYPHYEKLNQGGWGLIIYDEVHLLPAPVFRLTAELQSTRRLGLTATLVREDGAEAEVFSMIGPRVFDIPWKQLEQQGWIAETACYEIGVPADEATRIRYLSSPDRQKYRIAAENPLKLRVIRSLLRSHAEDRVLIIGHYVEQLKRIARDLNAPLITGQTDSRKRVALFQQFREGAISVLVVSKVANIAIDLPNANVAIQVSGSFGSRQEEAQRLGRLLRPNADGRPSRFYSLVTKQTCEQERALHRQLFLVEQGYEYKTIDAEKWLRQGEDNR
ncbi:DNA repair helicase XPB [Effusibacillus pohliae]|uniref:DNA repair helicase XPB n=1 Tax=Effusibacillus pohliae TaxID=232270 RepID=UPI00035CDC51|nr:DNA repair helicase XPB [Effusibacillus pohliae]